MVWTEQDKLLFSTINQFGKSDLETQIQSASKKFVKLKQRPEFFVVFGYYDLQKNEFVWQNNMNKMTADFVKKGYMSLFHTYSTLKKLLQPTVKFDQEDMNIIPYLVEILNAKFSVIRFKGPKEYIYALTTIDGVRETFKYQDFHNALFIYRNYDKIEKKYGCTSKKTQKTQQTQKTQKTQKKSSTTKKRRATV